MGGFPAGFVETVRSAGDIVRLVGDYVPLRAAGSRHKGLCPFHQEKTPSFSVDPSRQLFYCFGCQTGGDIFKFVMLYEKVGFPEAVELVARRSGVPLPQVEQRSDGPHDRLLRLNEAAQSFFRASLEDAESGAVGRAYLAQRRIDATTATRLGLGYAPAAWEALRPYLLSKRFKIEDALTAGLLAPRKSGSGEYDRFRNRLMFPIRDVRGRTVAFGGRTLGDDEAKYINSPETPAYKKGEHLYGLDLARDAIRREGFAIVVEGYLDLAAVLQAGFMNVVASLGTAFTEAQARLLTRYCEKVVFSYDGDGAGTAATVRSLDLLLARGLEVRVVPLPGGTDPDDYIGEHGAEAYGELIRQAPVYLQFLIDREAGQRDLSRTEEKLAALQAVLPHLARLASVVERSAWAGRLADTLRIEEEWVLQELRGAVRSSSERIRQRPAARKRLTDAELRLVSLLLRTAERGAEIPPIDRDDLAGTRVLPIVQAILALVEAGQTVSYPAVLDALADDADRTLLTAIAFRDEPEDGPSIELCLAALQRDYRVGREQRQLLRQIKDLPTNAVSDSDLTRVLELARQRDSLS